MKDGQIGVPVKDYIAQSGEFTFCIFVLAAVALKAWQERRRYALAAVLLALVFLANVLYAANSRTALVVIPVLLLLFACKHLNWKGMASLLLAVVVAAALGRLSAR